jgi:hypothetical protein
MRVNAQTALLAAVNLATLRVRVISCIDIGNFLIERITP